MIFHSMRINLKKWTVSQKVLVQLVFVSCSNLIMYIGYLRFKRLFLKNSNDSINWLICQILILID